MRVALISEGAVKNIAIVDREYRPQKGFIAVETEYGQIGDLYDGENFTSPDPPRLSKGELLAYAHQRYSITLNSVIEFNLAEPDEIVHIHMNAMSREAIAALAEIAKSDLSDAVLVSGDKVIRLNYAQIIALHRRIIGQIAHSQAVLGEIIEAIESKDITLLAEIDLPEKANLPSWILPDA